MINIIFIWYETWASSLIKINIEKKEMGDGMKGRKKEESEKKTLFDEGQENHELDI